MKFVDASALTAMLTDEADAQALLARLQHHPKRTTSPLAVEAYDRCGKSRHPAALNFGDCFAYACARHDNLPRLYKGDDFSQTDIAPA